MVVATRGDALELDGSSGPEVRCCEDCRSLDSPRCNGAALQNCRQAGFLLSTRNPYFQPSHPITLPLLSLKQTPINLPLPKNSLPLLFNLPLPLPQRSPKNTQQAAQSQQFRSFEASRSRRPDTNIMMIFSVRENQIRSPVVLVAPGAFVLTGDDHVEGVGARFGA